MARRQRNERGAYAVLFGIMVVVLMSIAALAVDIGNAVARKSDVQAQADFAALAAGRELSANTGAVPTAAVNAARDYLNNNSPQNKDCAPTCVTSADLTDTDLTNGDIRFTNEGLRVTAPEENVEYGLARVMGFQDKDVIADATVKIGSYGAMNMPAYAVNPCDYGRQVLTDPSTGHAVPVDPPPLQFDLETNTTVLESISPTSLAYETAPSTLPTITLTGKRFTNTTQVGFFNDSGGYYTYTLPAPLTTGPASSTILNITVPLNVVSSETVWYVRVLNQETPAPAAATWSASSEAVPLRIGNAVLECDSDVLGGNFGTIRMDRTDEEAEELARNFATGFQSPITVVPHGIPEVVGKYCQHHVLDATSVESDEGSIGLNPSTNCILTDPGLPANAAAEGLVEGGSGFNGRLTNKATKAGCDPSGGSASRVVNLHGNFTINNEVLSCYLTSSTMPLSQVARAGYSGGAAFDESIWDSPRFAFVPVLRLQPDNGLKRYSIIEMRAAFITDEALTSTKGSSSASSDNGLKVEHNDITQITVVFFNMNALPPNPGGTIIDYLGSGPKAVQLVD